MNCSPTIAIALLLLSLTGGMLLLYKSQKENLNAFFKVIAWLVIVVSLGSMVCCGVRCVMHGCMRSEECREMERCEGMGDCDRREGMMKHCGMNKEVIICTDGEETCPMKEGKCCKEGMEGECKEKCEEGEKKECCKKGGEKCEKKDSVKVTVKVK